MHLLQCNVILKLQYSKQKMFKANMSTAHEKINKALSFLKEPQGKGVSKDMASTLRMPLPKIESLSLNEKSVSFNVTRDLGQSVRHGKYC